MQPSLLTIMVGLGISLALLALMLTLRFLWLAHKNGQAWLATNDHRQNLQQIKSERDQLKAELAMLTRKHELALQDHSAEMAERLAEIARYRHRLEQVAKQSATMSQTPLSFTPQANKWATKLDDKMPR